MKPRLLDLFCGAGGATRGYQLAGFYVVGVDVNPQPDYCGDEFFQEDACDLLRLCVGTTDWFASFDAIHASPPCQLFSRAGRLRDAQGGQASTVDLLTPTLARLADVRVPWVVENVPGAPGMLPCVQLCGSSFGLAVQRHRLFKSNVEIFGSPCDHSRFPLDEKSGKPRPVGVYHVMGDSIPSGGRTARTLEEGQTAMGIDWMPWASLKEAIPPAYTQHLGKQLLAHLAAVSQ